MQTQCNPSRPGLQFELRFTSIFDDGRGYAFPCDASGTVDLDAMSERLRNNYLYVRTLIGRDFTAPAVLPRHLH
ncbi:MAG: hypothetical protein ABIX12_05725 [Rubrivivax sp.]